MAAEGCKSVNVNLAVIWQNESRTKEPKQISVCVQPEDCVSQLKRKVAVALDQSEDCIKLVFSGQVIGEDCSSVAALDIGPATVIHALVLPLPTTPTSLHKDSIGRVKISRNSESGPDFRAYFYVYCKGSCKSLQRGKLRVRCAQCKSDAVVLHQEPSCWNDILTPKRFRCECIASDSCSDNYAEFYFKCVQCSEKSPPAENLAVPLPQIKSNLDKTACGVCGAVSHPILTFSCLIQHVVCIECFVAYATVRLHERGFVLNPVHGYTLPCSMSGCTGLVTEPHHFRLMGSELYQRYQDLATEVCLLGQGGVFCPKPGCGAAFLLDETPELIQNLVVCSECNTSFCRFCSSGAVECMCDQTGANHNREDSGIDRSSGTLEPIGDTQRSLLMIRVTCKPCPKCHVPTEKNGGCNHMNCRQCGFDWCWLCKVQWTDECQWDHWFEA